MVTHVKGAHVKRTTNRITTLRNETCKVSEKEPVLRRFAEYELCKVQKE